VAPIDPLATATTRARYQRLSSLYDWIEWLPEKQYRLWRKKLWSLVDGQCVLEVGVGTGRNIPYWPAPSRAKVTAIDLTPGMLVVARRQADRLHRDADLRLGDVQALDFEDASFDTAVATCVFCSVPDPLLGLNQLARVVRPGGQVLLLEHVRPDGRFLGAVVEFLNPILVRLMGANMNRRTVETVQQSSFITTNVIPLGPGWMFRLIEARVPVARQTAGTQYAKRRIEPVSERLKIATT
jgi:phosphatidylethanolamine/phosphatidyl-N-methylethanolamine N-methyltransferase